MQCTEPQAEILTACMLGGDDANRAFNQSITLNMVGNLSVIALENAVSNLVQRHESLRTVFNISENSFAVLADMPVKMDVHQSGDSHEKFRNLLSGMVHKDAMHVFDLAKGPLFKVSLLTDGDQQHHLLLTLHHVVCDGWSLALIIKDLAAVYNACLHPQTDQPAMPGSFTQYARQEFAFMGTEAYEGMKTYWRQQFDSFISDSGLPYDHPRPKYPDYKSHHITYPLSRELFARVRTTAKDNGCSVLVTMISMMEVLLYRASGKNNFVIGIPTAGQAAAGYEDLIGHCVHMLPVKTSIDGTMKFAEYLQVRKKAIAEAFDNRRFTFGSLLKNLKFNRDVSAVPLVPVTFNIDRPLMDGVSFDGIQPSLTINNKEFSSFEMIMNLSRREDELIIECTFRDALFEKETVMNFLRQYEFVAGALCENQDMPIDHFSPHNTEELIKKLEKWNDTSVDFPDKDSFTKLFEKAAHTYPDNTALVFNEQKYTYSELNDMANRLSRQLIQAGLKRGDLAGVMLERSPEMLLSLLAVMKAGAAYIPIDPSFPADRIKFILEDAKAGLLIASSSAGELIPERSIFIDIEAAILQSLQMDAQDLDLQTDSSDLAYVIYTSGSTGQPKGVMVEHKSLVNLLHSMSRNPGFQPGDKLLAVTTVSFDIAGLELYLPLFCGGTLVLADQDTVKDGQLLLNKIGEEHITVMQATPSTFKLMLANNWKGSPDLTLLCGGEALSRELVIQLLPKCKALWNVYGPTETTIWSAMKKMSALDEVVSIGHGIDNTELYILDEKLALMPEGKVGEICIAGAGLARGYLYRDELTESKFVKHPLKPGQRIYKTGDLGKMLPDGELICLGRTDNQIKVRGYRIETGEIEHSLSNLSGIKEAVVIPKENKQDDTRLIAFIIADTTAEQVIFYGTMDHSSLKLANVPKEKENEWKKGLASTLPEYMIPSVFVYLKTWPLTPNGKIDRKSISGIDVLGVIMQMDGKSDANSAGREWSALEKQLKGIWEETLGIHHINPDDNFFDLGGHSLIGIELMNKIEKQLQLKLPLSSLFVHPSIAGLATFIEKNEAPDWKFLVPIKASGNKSPIYLVHGAGLEVMVFKEIAKYVDEEQPVYGVQAMGLYDETKPADTVEEIAANYLREILVQNPDGPYALAGFSAGSVLAFEMARQLQAKGKTVSMLGNFDFSFENLKRKMPFGQKLKNMLLEFYPRQVHTFGNVLKYPLKTMKFQQNFMKLRLMGILGRLGYNNEEIVEPNQGKKFEIMDMYQYALDHYEVKPYNGKIDLFRSKIKLYYLRDLEFLGWGEYALKGINIHPVDGDHDSMILQPHSEAFARILQKVLDQNHSGQAK